MEAMSDPAVEVRNLSRSFGRKRVLDNVSLTVLAVAYSVSWAKAARERRPSSSICWARSK